ncbi:MAG: type I DNA topoisomerase [Clostridia bacterium]|nr:type I DNA topoisomerase [Clostridia bacterium]
MATQKKLVIVESPTKVESIKKYLGSGYTIEATMGHVRDLPKSQLGVDLKNDFEPSYITIRGKGDLIAKLKKKAKAADKVLLATDPDREGEAISWHLANVLGIDPSTACRITFNEVTKDVVKAAVKEARPINMDLVDAQQTRRVLDRIVGYQLSPILWKKVKKGLSAGRVQSVVVRMIVDREREIDAFNPEEYWTIDVKLTNDKGKLPFDAKFYGLANGKKMALPDEEKATEVLDALNAADYKVKSVVRKETKRRSAPPFTTSTLQQEASRKLNFTSRRTMIAAQQLYEMGYITYMRTDSLRISPVAQSEARDFIVQQYGAAFVPKTPKYYKAKKSAQDAHEAIRPTSCINTPELYKEKLKPDLYKLYRLIWLRFMASQMSDAILDSVTADITAGDYLVRAVGSETKFAGFMTLYVESKDEAEEKSKKLPTLTEGQELLLKDIESEQHFTQPPARYTEASLVKAMEEEGIGRPSTYAPTLATITSARGYVARDGKSLYPTELGYIVTDLLKENFKDIVDTEFTANMEDKIETVADGTNEWKNIIRDFYNPFAETLKDAEEKIGHVEIKDEVSDVPCDKCGRMMVYKQGRFGKFLACPGFPECRNTKAITQELSVPCPKCGGKVVVRKSKKGATFYTCDNSPSCDFISWDEPTAEKCPECGGAIMKVKAFKRKGPTTYKCFNEDCKYVKKPAQKKK